MARKKKDTENKVVQLVPAEPSADEVVEQMKRDEEELNGYLNKFKTVALPDTSKIEEDDEEEEESLTLDFDKMEAYQVEEGVIVRDGEELITSLDDEQLTELIKKVIEPKPTLQTKYGDMIAERFVSKAIASLIKKLNNAAEAAESAAEKEMRYFQPGYLFAEEACKPIYKHKEELKKAFYLGTIKWDCIPQWAESYIDEYVQNAINALLDFVERD